MIVVHCEEAIVDHAMRNENLKLEVLTPQVIENYVLENGTRFDDKGKDLEIADRQYYNYGGRRRPYRPYNYQQYSYNRPYYYGRRK